PWNSGGPVSNVFVRDLTARTTTLVSVTSDGHVSNGNSTLPAFSPDGNRVAFLSTSSNLTGQSAGDSQGNTNLFVRDLSAGTTTLVSVNTNNALSSGYVAQMAFSPDGQSLAFVSSGTDLTTDAANPPPTTA